MASIKERIVTSTNSVTNGKDLIAKAITSKLGNSATKTETFSSLASKITGSSARKTYGGFNHQGSDIVVDSITEVSKSSIKYLETINQFDLDSYYYTVDMYSDNLSGGDTTSGAYYGLFKKIPGTDSESTVTLFNNRKFSVTPFTGANKTYGTNITTLYSTGLILLGEYSSARSFSTGSKCYYKLMKLDPSSNTLTTINEYSDTADRSTSNGTLGWSRLVPSVNENKVFILRGLTYGGYGNDTTSIRLVNITSNTSTTITADNAMVGNDNTRILWASTAASADTINSKYYHFAGYTSTNEFGTTIVGDYITDTVTYLSKPSDSNNMIMIGSFSNTSDSYRALINNNKLIYLNYNGGGYREQSSYNLLYRTGYDNNMNTSGNGYNNGVCLLVQSLSTGKFTSYLTFYSYDGYSPGRMVYINPKKGEAYGYITYTDNDVSDNIVWNSTDSSVYKGSKSVTKYVKIKFHLI